ncbi:replication-relaxation family protein, partial [Thermoanaerobacter thermohydrosulfuricus]
KNQEEKKKEKKIIKKKRTELGYREMLLIADLYDLRYITTDQANEHYYKKEDGTNARMDWTYRKLNLLVKEGLLDTVLFPMNLRYKKLYYLTDAGIDKALDLRDEDLFRLDLEGNLRELYRTAAENLLDEKAIRHQLFLNEIYFALLETLGRGKFEWKDTAKSIIEFQNTKIMPDAAVKVGFLSYLIEADNGTYSAKRLKQRMKAYNKFLEKSKELDEEYAVLFICNTENRKNKDKRIDSIIDVATAEIPVCAEGIDFYVMSLENFKSSFYEYIYEVDIEGEKSRNEIIAERIANQMNKKYETEYEYQTLYGSGTASTAIVDESHTYTIEDLTLGNIKNYQRFREAVKISRYGQVTPIAIVANEERAKIEAEKLSYTPSALFYTLDREKIIGVLPDEVIERNLK